MSKKTSKSPVKPLTQAKSSKTAAKSPGSIEKLVDKPAAQPAAKPSAQSKSTPSAAWVLLPLAIVFLWALWPNREEPVTLSNQEVNEQLAALKAEVEELSNKLEAELDPAFQAETEMEEAVVKTAKGTEATEAPSAPKAMLKRKATTEKTTAAGKIESPTEEELNAISDEIEAAKWASTKSGAEAVLLFEFGSATLTDASEQQLESFVEAASNEAIVDVIGFTDSIGKKQKNMRLGAERANTVFRYLRDNGINAQKVELSAHSMKNFIGNNRSSFGRMVNRRVELRVRESVS